MKIITGDEFGIIKLISTQSKTVIDQYGALDSSNSIINIFSNNKIEQINYSEENEEEESETKDSLNLYVSSLNENYILNWDSKNIISSYKNENLDFIYISSTIKFPYEKNKNTVFINGLSDSRVNIVSFNEELKFNNSSIYSPLDTSNKNLKIKLRGVANSIYNTDSVYLLYQNNPFILYNINEQKIEFKGKNLPNDELNLRIPMHDMDIVEVKNNPRLNYISTAFGEIRLYDKKASPRPSLNKKITNTKINKIDITDDSNYLFIGDNSGYCAMLDIRKSFSACKTFKGNTGAIQTLVNIEQNNKLIVAGFDRYVKVYDYKNGEEEKIFVKNKVNSAILVGLEKNKEFKDDEESEIKDSELAEEEGGEEDDSENIENNSNEQKSVNSNSEQDENEEENDEENEDVESQNKNEEDEEKDGEETEENKEEEDEDNDEEDDSYNKESSNKNSNNSEEKEEENEEDIEDDGSDNKESSNKNSDKLEEKEEENEEDIEDNGSDNKESNNKNSDKLEEDEEDSEDNEDIDDVNRENKNSEEEEVENEEENDEDGEQEEEDINKENKNEIDLNEEENESNESEYREENDITEEQEEIDIEEEEESEKKYNNRKRKREEKVTFPKKNKKKKIF